VDGDGAVSFEAKLEPVMACEREGVRWSAHNSSPPILKQAAELFRVGLSVREVAAALRISKTETGRLRLRALDEGLLVTVDDADPSMMNGHDPILRLSTERPSPIQG